MEIQLNIKAMLKDIDDIVNSDWGFDIDCLALHPKQKIPQKTAWEMQRALMRIYRISHQLHCEACRDNGKYVSSPPKLNS